MEHTELCRAVLSQQCQSSRQECRQQREGLLQNSARAKKPARVLRKITPKPHMAAGGGLWGGVRIPTRSRMAPPAARKALLNAAGCQERSADTSPARALSTNRFLKKQNQRHSLSAGLRAMHCPAPSAPSPLDFSKSNDEEKPSCQVGVIWFQFGFGAQQLSPTPHWSARCYSARGVSRRESLALNGGRTPRRGDGSREQRAEGWGLGSGLPHCPPCPSTAAHVPSDPNGECQCWAPPVVPGRSSQQGLKFRGFGQPPPPPN